MGLDALRTSNTYHIAVQDMTTGYTQIPVKLCAAPITHAAYLVGCYLFKLIGVGKRRSVPEKKDLKNRWV